MSAETIVMLLTFVLSAVALYFSTRKQKHEEAGIDADTIGKLYDLIEKQETRYQALKADQETAYKGLKAEFDTYKETASAQIADIASENVKLRRWAKRLVAQLEAAGIVPVKFEE
jgi:hypothetical protein